DGRDAVHLGVHFSKPKIDVGEVRTFAQKVVDKQVKGLMSLCRARKVQFKGTTASFVDSRTLQLADGGQVKFKNCILATGSVPARPPALFPDSPRVVDSTGALKLEDVPKSLLVIGGGYIGLELGYVYAALGSAVTVVEMTDGLLPGVDRDLVKPLQDRLTPL